MSKEPSHFSTNIRNTYVKKHEVLMKSPARAKTYLHNIIPILILSQHADRLQNLIHHYTLSCWIMTVLQDPLSHENCVTLGSLLSFLHNYNITCTHFPNLYHTATIWMGGQCHNLIIKC